MTFPDASPANYLLNRRVAFVGKLGGVTKREAQKLVRDHGGTPVEGTAEADLIVIGADALPLDEADLIDASLRQAADLGTLEIVRETQLWQSLGLVDENARLYTPAMLAELIKVPVSTIRRWHRRGLIIPIKEVNRLPYFDFQEVATARQLASLLAAGISAKSLETKLQNLLRWAPEGQRPLAQLSVILEGKQLLLRQGEGLIEPGGQLRIDFDSIESAHESEIDLMPTISLEEAKQTHRGPEDLLQFAAELEDEGELEGAAELYRAALAAGGPKAEVCFQLAELLYRLGDVTAARERYYMAIELDEDYVEARANLGCVLAETGQFELAVAAFQGALNFHRDYPDVHYHLARALDEIGQTERALEHWRAFLQLAPDSPWSDVARSRLSGQ